MQHEVSTEVISSSKWVDTLYDFVLNKKIIHTCFYFFLASATTVTLLHSLLLLVELFLCLHNKSSSSFQVTNLVSFRWWLGNLLKSILKTLAIETTTWTQPGVNLKIKLENNRLSTTNVNKFSKDSNHYHW